jgi:hypothetical protein
MVYGNYFTLYFSVYKLHNYEDFLMSLYVYQDEVPLAFKENIVIYSIGKMLSSSIIRINNATLWRNMCLGRYVLFNVAV